MNKTSLLLVFALLPFVFFSQLNVGFSTIINPACPGAATGSLVVAISGGNPPYAIEWFDGSIEEFVDNLPSGTYCVTVTDADFSTMEICQTLNDPLQINYDVQLIKSDVCEGNSDGSVVLNNIQGGTVFPNSCGLNNGLTCTSVTDSLIIGDGSTSNTSSTYPAIFGNYWYGARHQMIYRADELLNAGVQPGLIKGIGIEILSNSGTSQFDNFSISMKCTQSPDLLLGYENNVTTVFPSASISLQIGWNYFEFPVAYYWNGIDNIVVGTCFNNGSYTNNAVAPLTTTSYASTFYFFSDSYSNCTATGGTASFSRPDIKLINCQTEEPFAYLVNWSNGEQGYTNENLVPGVYSFQIEDYYGCTVNDELTILERPNPIVNLGLDSILCLDQIPFIIDAGNPGSNFLWNNAAITQTIEISETNTYSVIVTNEWACVGLDEVYLEVENCYTEINEMDSNKAITVYPNPSSGKIHIKFGDGLSDSFLLNVLDNQGKVVIANHVVIAGQNIDLCSLEPGFYYVQVELEMRSFCEKVIILAK